MCKISSICRGEKLSRAEKSLIKVACIVGLGGLTLGYNIGVVAGGLEDLEDYYNLSLNKEGFFVAAMALGSVIGSLFGGVMSDIIGRWWTCQYQAMLFLAGTLIIACGPSYQVLVAGRFVVGIGAAITSIASVPYLKEISPTKYKGRFQGAFEISVSAGILISNMLNLLAYFYGIPWRLLFGFPVPLVLAQSALLFLLPESPSFLAQKGRLTEAAEALEVIYNDPEIVQNEIYALRLENMKKVSGAFQTFYYFTRMFRSSLILVLILVILQSLSGVFVFSIYGANIYENTGYSRVTSMYYNLCLSGVRLIVTSLAVLRIDTFGWGRRQLLLRGLLVSIIGYIALVLTYYFHNDPISRYFYLLDSMIIMSGYSLSFGIVVRILQSEMFPTVIRSRTMSITSFAQNLAQAIILLVFLRATDVSSYGSVFLIFSLFSLMGLVFAYYFIPETVGRTPEQILRQADERIFKYCRCAVSKSTSSSLSSSSEQLSGDAYIGNPIDQSNTSYIPPKSPLSSSSPTNRVGSDISPARHNSNGRSLFGLFHRTDEPTNNIMPAMSHPRENQAYDDDVFIIS